MTTFTPASFARACGEFSALESALPAAVLGPIAEASKGLMSAASASSGGVRAAPSEFHLKKPKKSGASANAAIVGAGFAVLDEFGSYKHPHGFPINPKKSGKRQQRAKRASFDTRARAAARALGYQKSVLSSGPGGFVAAYVTNHPPIKAHPYVAKAEVGIGKLMEEGYDKATLAIIAKAFG